jgi:uncharacterized protein (DUF2147 family)
LCDLEHGQGDAVRFKVIKVHQLGGYVMAKIYHWFFAATFACLCTSAWAESEGSAEVPRGLWHATADAQGISFHVRTRRCSRALCGRVERVKNRRGFDAPSNAVGQKVLWELRPQADGSFLGEYRDNSGKAWPETRVEVQGNALRLRICGAEGCRDETWKRLR